jgi:hypothetical protein
MNATIGTCEWRTVHKRRPFGSVDFWIAGKREGRIGRVREARSGDVTTTTPARVGRGSATRPRGTMLSVTGARIEDSAAACCSDGG